MESLLFKVVFLRLPSVVLLTSLLQKKQCAVHPGAHERLHVIHSSGDSDNQLYVWLENEPPRPRQHVKGNAAPYFFSHFRLLF